MYKKREVKPRVRAGCLDRKQEYAGWDTGITSGSSSYSPSFFETVASLVRLSGPGA